MVVLYLIMRHYKKRTLDMGVDLINWRSKMERYLSFYSNHDYGVFTFFAVVFLIISVGLYKLGELVGGWWLFWLSAAWFMVLSWIVLGSMYKYMAKDNIRLSMLKEALEKHISTEKIEMREYRLRDVVRMEHCSFTGYLVFDKKICLYLTDCGRLIVKKESGSGDRFYIYDRFCDLEKELKSEDMMTGLVEHFSLFRKREVC